jgi:hypothetical protein
MEMTVHHHQLFATWCDHKIQDDDDNIFKVNGQRLKPFLELSHNSKVNQELDRIDLINS